MLHVSRVSIVQPPSCRRRRWPGAASWELSTFSEGGEGMRVSGVPGLRAHV